MAFNKWPVNIGYTVKTGCITTNSNYIKMLKELKILQSIEL